jgi:hypothetical protein
VGRFLEICQFLLGQLALAIVSHYQLLVLNFQVFHSAVGSQLLFERLHSIRKGAVACGLVAGIAGIVMVKDLGVV